MIAIVGTTTTTIYSSTTTSIRGAGQTTTPAAAHILSAQESVSEILTDNPKVMHQVSNKTGTIHGVPANIYENHIHFKTSASIPLIPECQYLYFYLSLFVRFINKVSIYNN